MKINVVYEDIYRVFVVMSCGGIASDRYFARGSLGDQESRYRAPIEFTDIESYRDLKLNFEVWLRYVSS